MRMIASNVLNTESTIRHAIAAGSSRYFAVSSDKAANPANAMGASKRVMELCLARASREIDVTSARFANVAFSDGSLLHGFTQRLAKRQPLSAPEDVHRYFITDSEAAVLCLMACLLGNNGEVFFPNVKEDFAAIDFRTIAERFLDSRGFRAHPCATEDEARSRVEELSAQGLWPCYFFSSDTTGEKEVEEFWMEGESLDVERFHEIGVIRWPQTPANPNLTDFLQRITSHRSSGEWTREQLLEELQGLLPEFSHKETGKFLDSRM
jgi:FlaA1/EpsC-like NDP-sugar epimerase